MVHGVLISLLAFRSYLDGIDMVHAVVVTYNPENHLLMSQYLSVSRQVDNVIYVDNGSECKIAFPNDCTVISNGQNLGLGKAQNIGIRTAISQGADFILLLDQDSLPDSDMVQKLMQVYDECKKKTKIAIVGPSLKNAYKSSAPDGYGLLISGCRICKVGLQRCTEVSYCISSGSLIPVEALKDVGYIEEKLFIDGMDLEWCLRARNKGYSVIQTALTALTHRLGEGSDDRIMSHSPFREYFIVRNDVWISRQSHIPYGYRLRKMVTPFTRLFSAMLRFRWDYVKQQIKGYVDGYRL